MAERLREAARIFYVIDFEKAPSSLALTFGFVVTSFQLSKGCVGLFINERRFVVR